MSDKPILFSGPMVRALLAGTKTQTRRVIPEKMQDAYYEYDEWCRSVSAGVPSSRQWEREYFLERVRIQAGDRLYVREAWRSWRWNDGLSPSSMPDSWAQNPGEYVSYIADTDDKRMDGRSRQGMHMPRWASRLTLSVTEVRVERLQDISEADALAEGCIPDDQSLNPNHIGPARELYASLWDSINGAGAWDANPWVAAYTFAVHHGNIDHLAESANG